jgi:hypothetical protein
LDQTWNGFAYLKVYSTFRHWVDAVIGKCHFPVSSSCTVRKDRLLAFRFTQCASHLLTEDTAEVIYRCPARLVMSHGVGRQVRRSLGPEDTSSWRPRRDRLLLSDDLPVMPFIASEQNLIPGRENTQFTEIL